MCSVEQHNFIEQDCIVVQAHSPACARSVLADPATPVQKEVTAFPTRLHIGFSTANNTVHIIVLLTSSIAFLMFTSATRGPIICDGEIKALPFPQIYKSQLPSLQQYAVEDFTAVSRWSSIHGIATSVASRCSHDCHLMMNCNCPPRRLHSCFSQDCLG
jgi:hypothetical protein